MHSESGLSGKVVTHTVCENIGVLFAFSVACEYNLWYFRVF